VPRYRGDIRNLPERPTDAGGADVRPPCGALSFDTGWIAAEVADAHQRGECEHWTDRGQCTERLSARLSVALARAELKSSGRR